MGSTKKAFAILLSALLTVSLAACGNNQKQENAEATSAKQETTAAATEEKAARFDVTLSMSIPQSNLKDSYKPMLEKVKEITGITIDAQAIPDNQFTQLIQTKLATGDMTDLIVDQGAPTQAKFINVSPNDSYWADLSDQPWVERLVNKNFKSKNDGKYYLAPLSSAGTPMATFYNKELFEKAGIKDVPKTWNDFIAACEALKKAGINPILMTDKDLWTTQIYPNHVFNPFLAGADQAKIDVIKVALDSNQKAAKDYPEIFKKGLEMFSELYTKGYTNKNSLTFAYDNSFEEMSSGKSAMYTMGPWWLNDLEKKFPGSSDKFGAFPMPTIDNPPLFCGFTCGGYVVYNESKNLDAAKAALNALTLPEVIGMYYQENPNFSAYTDVDGGKLLNAIADLGEQFIKSQNMIGDAIDLQCRNDEEIWKLYQALVAGAKTPDQVVEGMDKIFKTTGKAKNLSGF